VRKAVGLLQLDPIPLLREAEEIKVAL